jgi:hypothetical protein
MVWGTFSSIKFCRKLFQLNRPSNAIVCDQSFPNPAMATF